MKFHEVLVNNKEHILEHINNYFKSVFSTRNPTILYRTCLIVWLFFGSGSENSGHKYIKFPDGDYITSAENFGSNPIF